MSANATLAPAAVVSVHNGERGHRVRLFLGYLLAIGLVVGLSIYGFSYYTLSSAERPFSPKHAMLRPSGSIGLNLGFMGFAIFMGIFLYPLRKAWPWLGQQGSARHWLDIHVLLGLTAPFIIAFHSSFKFRGFAGIAFWIMLAVSLSGVIGRYLYSQIPRSLNAAELSMRELQELQEKLAAQLDRQNLLPQADIRSLLKLPSQEQVDRMFAPISLVYMMLLDVARAFGIARLRRHALSFGDQLSTLAGFLKTRNRDLEKAISMAREEASTAKRVLFLKRSQQVFHLWHVVHKPFSYTFALLAVIHIAVVMMMGYF
jgi:hypothetical protein